MIGHYRGMGAQLPGQLPVPTGTTPVPASTLFGVYPNIAPLNNVGAYPLTGTPGVVYLVGGGYDGTPITEADAHAYGIPISQIQNAWTLEDPCSDYSYMVMQAAGNAQAGIYKNQLIAQGAPQSQIDAVRFSGAGRPGPRIPILADNSPLAVFLQNWTAQAVANPSTVVGPQCPGQSCSAMQAAGMAAEKFCAGAAPGVVSPPAFDPTKQPVQIVNPVTSQITTIAPAAVAAAAAAAVGAPTTVTAPTVVNPSPASQPVTTGSTVAAPNSALSIANGASLQTAPATSDIIAGIPNEWLLIGGAGVVVLMLFMAGGK